MQDVSDKLLGMFVECLKGKVGDGSPDEAVATPTPITADAPTPDAPPPAAPAPPEREEVEALDLGATVLPVLAKAYWKPALAVVVVIIVVLVVVL